MTDAYQINNLIFRYDKYPALSLPELQIQRQCLTALVGPNGSGKSTLLNLLAFLNVPNEGWITFFGERVTRQHLLSFRRRIAYLPQKPYLFRGTVEDNLKLALRFRQVPNKHRQNRIRQVLQALNILPLNKQLTHTLSGGELQKVALARAILTEPEVLLMDEPFSYLDYESERLLEQFFNDYIRESGGTLIFSTHDRVQGQAITDEVISLIDGKAAKTTLLNVFHGQLEKQLFKTGKIDILLADSPMHCKHIAIDPQEIVLSNQPLISSMRNQFLGRVNSISEDKGNVRVSVNAGEVFQALITHNALEELNLKPGGEVWVTFKSNSVVTI